jgi:hypothetical protein
MMSRVYVQSTIRKLFGIVKILAFVTSDGTEVFE